MRSARFLLVSLTLVGHARQVGAQISRPAPWTPPRTTLPKRFVNEVAFLLAHGLADPRGGTYRAAAILSGGDDPSPTCVHGWVLGSRIIPGGDGLAYEMVGLGPAADLDADVRESLRSVGPDDGTAGRFAPDPRWQSLSAAELLLAGRADLAEKVGPRDEPVTGDDGLIAAFAVGEFHRVVNAFTRGDDMAVLRLGRELLREQPALEREALARNGQRYATGEDGRTFKTDEQLPFLAPLPRLLTDAERRVVRGPRPEPFDPKTASVAQLIDRLDEVRAPRGLFTGQPDLRHDPIVAALVARGRDAAEPLLDAIERDDRLTRTVAGQGDEERWVRDPVTVRRAAYVAFTGIADTTVFDRAHGERVDVAKLRAFWRANAARTGPERWLATLADDAAGERRWMNAATRLFEGERVVRTEESVSIPRDPGPLKAEALCGRRDPALGDLLARRARGLVALDAAKGGGAFAEADGLRLALDLARWEPYVALPALQDVTRTTMTNAVRPNGQDLDTIQGNLVAAWEARQRLGDRAVWTEVADWLPRLREPVTRSQGVLVFLPLVRHSGEPAFRGLAARLFRDPGSTQNPSAVSKLRPASGEAGSMATSPLLQFPEFRASVVEVLDDLTPIGEGRALVDGSVEIRVDNVVMGYHSNPGRVRPGARWTYRVGDAMAEALSGLRGAPRFEPFGTGAERDAAIGRIKAFLRSRRTDFAKLVPWPTSFYPELGASPTSRSRS